METTMTKKIEDTIMKACGHIEKRIDDPLCQENSVLAEEMKALAELIQAKAYLDHINS